MTLNVKVGEFSIQHIKKLLHQVIEADRCTLRDLATIAGKLMSAVKAFGPVVPVMLRSTFYFISVTVGSIGADGAYETSVVLSSRMRCDLKFLHDNLTYFNGFPVFPNKIGFCLNSAIDQGDIPAASLALQNSEDLWVSGSSDIILSPPLE